MNKIEDHGDIKVHYPLKGESGYCISYIGGGWMPGKYDSVKSAVKGGECCFIDEARFVRDIQKPINHVDKGAREITIKDMEGF